MTSPASGTGGRPRYTERDGGLAMKAWNFISHRPKRLFLSLLPWRTRVMFLQKSLSTGSTGTKKTAGRSLQDGQSQSRPGSSTKTSEKSATKSEAERDSGVSRWYVAKQGGIGQWSVVDISLEKTVLLRNNTLGFEARFTLAELNHHFDRGQV